MNTQAGLTAFESRFNGPYPFTSDGSLIGTPTVEARQEEMETMIAFAGGRIHTVTSCGTRTCTNGGATTSARAGTA